MDTKTITLETICHGGVPEIFERELAEVGYALWHLWAVVAG